MSLSTECKVLGPLQTNTYILQAGDTWAVVDPAMAAGGMIRFLQERRADVSMILLTHGHGDHIGGIDEIKQAYPAARSYCPAGDEPMLQDPDANLSGVFGLAVVAGAPDELLHPPTVVEIDGTCWQVLATPGHSPGGVSYYCPEAGVALTGDTLFCGGIGRVDFPGGDRRTLLKSIRDRLLTLPDETRVLPGHGPETTIGRERRTNPFLTGEW